MVRRMLWRVLALALFAVPGLPAHAAEAYQVSTISSLLAGGYDGTITVGEILSHGNFGLGTFNGVDGEMMVLDGQVYRASVDGRAHLVDLSELTPFAVVVLLQPQSSMAVAAGQSLEQLEAALDALPYSASRILAARVDGGSRRSGSAASPSKILPIAPWSRSSRRSRSSTRSTTCKAP
jgi:acetolactate decarboxylase